MGERICHDIAGGQHPDRRGDDRGGERAKKRDRERLGERVQKRRQLRAGRGRDHQGEEVGKLDKAAAEPPERKIEPHAGVDRQRERGCHDEHDREAAVR